MNSVPPPVSTFDLRLAAVSAAIDKHHVYLERYLTGLTRNHADAEDLLSKLWVHVLHKFKEEQIDHLPLLRRKAYQLFIDYYRKKRRDKTDFYEHLPEQPVEHMGKEAYSTAEEAVLRERFWAEFPVELTEVQREILWMSARHGFTIKEISERLAIAPSTASDWLTSARRAFVAHMNR